MTLRAVPLRRLVTNVVAKDRPGERPLINLDAVGQGTGQLLAEAQLSSSLAEQHLAAEPGDLLYCKLRPYLRKSCVPTEPVFASGEFLCLRPSEQSEARWLKYVSLSDTWAEFAMADAYGAKMPRTSWEHVAEFAILTPELAEQRRIADFLDDQVSRIDQAVTLRKEQRDRLDERRRSAVDLELNSVSDGVIPLRRLVRDVCVGIVIQPAALYVLDDIPGVAALRGTDIREGWIDTSAPVRLSVRGHRDNLRSQLRLGDVVVVRTGVAGTAAVIKAETMGWNCIDLVIVRTGPRLIPEFLELVLNHFASQAKIGAAASGSIQAHFGVGAVRDLEMPNASMNDQRRLARTIAGARADTLRARTAMEDQIRLLTERKRALITAAVTGEFEVATASGRGGV